VLHLGQVLRQTILTTTTTTTTLAFATLDKSTPTFSNDFDELFVRKATQPHHHHQLHQPPWVPVAFVRAR
jgi:hypothetical protein